MRQRARWRPRNWGTERSREDGPQRKTRVSARWIWFLSPAIENELGMIRSPSSQYEGACCAREALWLGKARDLWLSSRSQAYPMEGEAVSPCSTYAASGLLRRFLCLLPFQPRSRQQLDARRQRIGIGSTFMSARVSKVHRKSAAISERVPSIFPAPGRRDPVFPERGQNPRRGPLTRVLRIS